MDLGTALIGGAVGLVSGLATAYAAMRFRLREERAKSARELALRYAAARVDAGPVANSLAEQFGTSLVIVNEPALERRKYFLLPGTRALVGRIKDNDIVIAEPQASRRHMAFEVREAGTFAVDLGHGTCINGTRIAGPTLLKSGDVVTIGDTRMIFVAL